MQESARTQHRDRQEHKARLADLVVSTLFMLLGLYVSYVSIADYQAFSRGQVGPGVLPLLIGLTLVLTSALIMLRLRQGAAVEEGAEIPTLQEASRAGALLALTIVAVILIPMLGTLTTLSLFGLVETTLLERRDWKLGLLTAVLIPALLYIFFEAVLGVPLPAGRLGLL